MAAFCFHILALPCGEQKSENPPHMKTTTVASNNPINRLSCPLVLLVIQLALALASFARSPVVEAVDPPPPGGYAYGNTAAGQDALFRLTTGYGNTALGAVSLYLLTTGNYCTGVGAATLLLNTADDN